MHVQQPKAKGQEMRIAIIETGTTSGDLVAKHGDFPSMVEHWLRPEFPEASFEVVSVFQGQRLDIDALQADAYVLTGSPHGVYEQLPWMQELTQQLQALAARQTPMFGICFGHQIMAQAFGGHVEKSDKGWGVGVQRYVISEGDKKHELEVFIYHQDQVVRLPPQGKAVGGSSHCEYGVIEYEFPALSVQFHPEFVSEFVTDLVEAKSDPQQINKKAVVEKLKSNHVNPRGLARWVHGFFMKHAHK